MNKRNSQRAVKRGAKLLDKHLPGWAEKIKLNKLDMAVGVRKPSGCGCVAAQLDTEYGHWTATIYRLGLDANTGAQHYGFAPELRGSTNPEWKILEKLWKEEIRVRTT